MLCFRIRVVRVCFNVLLYLTKKHLNNNNAKNLAKIKQTFIFKLGDV